MSQVLSKKISSCEQIGYVLLCLFECRAVDNCHSTSKNSRVQIDLKLKIGMEI